MTYKLLLTFSPIVLLASMTFEIHSQVEGPTVINRRDIPIKIGDNVELPPIGLSDPTFLQKLIGILRSNEVRESQPSDLTKTIQVAAEIARKICAAEYNPQDVGKRSCIELIETLVDLLDFSRPLPPDSGALQIPRWRFPVINALVGVEKSALPALTTVIKTGDPESIKYSNALDVIRMIHGGNGKAAKAFLLSRVKFSKPYKERRALEAAAEVVGLAPELSFNFIKDRIVLLEPIALRFRLENAHTQPISIPRHISFQDGNLKLTIRKPDGSTVVPKQLSMNMGRTFDGGPFTVPNGSFREWTEVTENHLSEHFDQPGQYKIKASWADWFESGWKTLIVERPNGNDHAAYEYILSNRGTDMWSAMTLFGFREGREEFLTKFPEGIYSDYIRYSMARSYDNDAKEKALELLKKVRRDNPNFVYVAELNQKMDELKNGTIQGPVKHEVSDEKLAKIKSEASRTQDKVKAAVSKEFPNLVFNDSRISDELPEPSGRGQFGIFWAWTGDIGFVGLRVELRANKTEALRSYERSMQNYEWFYRVSELFGPHARMFKKVSKSGNTRPTEIYFVKGRANIHASILGGKWPTLKDEEDLILKLARTVESLIDTADNIDQL